MWMRWGCTVFWALGRPGAVRGGSCCLSCAAAGCPAGSVVGLAVYDSRLGSSGSSVRVRNSIHISVRTMLEMLPSQSRFVFRARGHGA